MTNPATSLKYIQYRLRQWAAWYEHDQGHFLGHSTRSLGYRLMIEGTIIKTHGHKPLTCHKDAEEIEAYVCELARDAPHIAFALRSHYFSWQALGVQAKSMQLKQSDMKYYIDRGHQWLLWRLKRDV